MPSQPDAPRAGAGGRPLRIHPLEISTPAGWCACPTCPADENVWPEAAFEAWASAGAARPKTPICAACLFERYPRVHRACATCCGRMYYHPARARVEFPQCMACRKSRIPTCTRCRRPSDELPMVGEVCLPCFRVVAPAEVPEPRRVA